jgi:hypothetical protein
MVRLPGIHDGKTISRPTGELFLHTMLEAMLRHQVHSEADIDILLAQQPSLPEKFTGGQ